MEYYYNMNEAIRNHCDVALAFTKRLLQDEKTKNSNAVLSPLSIHVVLSLIAAGSSGHTLNELLSFLKSNSTHHLNHFASQIESIVFADASLRGGPRLAFANGVWLDQSLSFKPSFKHLVDTAYKAKLSQVDFQHKAGEVISKVNSWAEKETNGLITEILPPGSVDNLSRLILANALYFNGTWEQQFNPFKTHKNKFYLLDGSSIEIPFMTSEKEQYLAAFDGFKVLALQYKQGYDQRRFSMYFFLPNENDGLPSLIQKLDSQSGFIDHHIPYQQVRVGKFMVPKFKFSFDIDVQNILKGMGLVSPFLEGGLLEMVDPEIIGRQLYVKNIFHKSFVEVNEEGTEAAAVSGVVVEMQCASLPSKNIMDFVADHPFLFAIREDKTATLLFVGQVLY